MLQWQWIIGWILAVMTGLSVVYGSFWSDSATPQWVAVLYVTFTRPAFTLAVAWVAFACIMGYGGRCRHSRISSSSCCALNDQCMPQYQLISAPLTYSLCAKWDEIKIFFSHCAPGADISCWELGVGGGMNIFTKITLCYFWSPNTQLFLNWATFGAQSGIFGTERPHFLTFYFGMIVKTKWKVCSNGQLAKKVGLQGTSSKIIVMIVETVKYARIIFEILSFKPS